MSKEAIFDKITNNHTEDDIYCIGNRVYTNDYLENIIKNNHISKCELISALKFSAGTNIKSDELYDMVNSSHESCMYSLIYTNEYKEMVWVNDVDFIGIISIIMKSNISKLHNFIVFRSSDAINIADDAINIYNTIYGKRHEISNNEYTITQFSELIGVSAQTLRNWDKAGTFSPAKTLESGKRLYTFEQSLKFNKNKEPSIGIGYMFGALFKNESTDCIRKYFDSIQCNDCEILHDDQWAYADRDNFKYAMRKILSGEVKYFVVVAENRAIDMSEMFRFILKQCGCQLIILRLN